MFVFKKKKQLPSPPVYYHVVELFVKIIMLEIKGEKWVSSLPPITCSNGNTEDYPLIVKLEKSMNLMNELSSFKWFLANSLINFHKIIYEIQKKEVNSQDLNIKALR